MEKTGTGQTQREPAWSDIRCGHRRVLLESLLIFGLFFLYASTPPPGVNEAHYLAKAKHYWNPTWCAGDMFLGSADAHAVFYWAFGWLTRWLPLASVAWVGRVVTWGLLAWSWQRLSWVIVPRRYVSLLTAGLFLVLIDRGHLSGEWVVGGVEAKGFAYILVLIALRSMVLGQWRRVWLWLGAASTFHVLVGGWSVVAAAIAWAVSSDGLAGRHRGNESTDEPALPSGEAGAAGTIPSVGRFARFVRQTPALLAGLLLALPGLIPALALSWSEPAATVRQANQIYVFGRLAHHLVPAHFQLVRVVSFGILLVLWGWVWLRIGRHAMWARLNGFALGAVLIGATGWAISVILAGHPAAAATVLRYYWFRCEDVAVPMVVAMGLPLIVSQWQNRRKQWAQWGWGSVILVPIVFFVAVFAEHQLDFRPEAERQSRPNRSLGSPDGIDAWRSWQRTCRWISTTLPSDIRVLTPRNQQTFKWCAGRSEVVSWKDIPQDAGGIVRWWETLQAVYPQEVVQGGLGALSDRRLVELAHKYGAQYILIDRARTTRRLGMWRVFPHGWDRESRFSLYRVPDAVSATGR